MPKLLVDVSAHGLGHLAQAMAVVEVLIRRRPDLDLVIRCAHTRALVEARCTVPFAHIEEAVDVGQVMVDATTPDLPATLAAYRSLHADWAGTVQEAARRLEAIGPDLLLADVPYLSLAAAAQVGVPALALCSLNWAEVVNAYHPAEKRIHGEIVAAYNQAARFIQVAPHMAMRDLDNTVSVGPIARQAQPRRGDLDTALGLEPGDVVVLVTLGGLPFDLPVKRWPVVTGLHYVLDRGTPRSPDVHTVAETGLHFPEVLASVDALVVKLGYGLAVEAAVARRPLLYLRRGHFPDEASIVAWLTERLAAREITMDQLLRGALAPSLRALLALPAGEGALAAGAEEAAAIVLAYL